MPGGRVYTSWDDFKLPRARRMMEDYMRYKETLEKDVEELASLRVRYRNGDKGLKDAILKLEKRIITEREDIKSKANEIIKAER